MRPLTASLTFSALAVAIAACGAPADTAVPADPDTAQVRIVADDMHFVDPPDHLPAGTTVVAIDNVGDASHDVTVEGVDGQTVGARGRSVEAGEITLEPGTYTIYCSVGGHRSDGMEFEVTVS